MLQYSTSFLAPIIPYISYSIPTTTCGPHTSYSYSPSLPLPSPFNLLQAPPTRARCILPRRDSCSLRPLPSPPPPAGLLPPCSLPTPADPWRAALSLLSMLAIGPFLSPPPSLRGGDPWLPPPRTSSSSSSARRQSGARRSLRLELGAPSSPPAGLEEGGGRRWPRDRAPGARRPQPVSSSSGRSLGRRRIELHGGEGQLLDVTGFFSLFSSSRCDGADDKPPDARWDRASRSARP
jgi:hypothetical protein